ncbi:MAG TPA: G1 family glutamic endopeptidase, partial [Trebonia sp.]|nr:G1 family glutamic endopeptidase [Trebonia sp.]
SGSGDKYSSFWVGLDGYSSNSVEQTGTDTDCSGSTPEYYGWYEMYPNPSYNFGNSISPGDTIKASVSYQGSNKYLLSLSDVTKGWTTTTTQTLSGAPRNSAEVILEAPCCTNSGGVLPLADFGTVNISDSLVNGAAIGTTNPAEIIMINNSGQDKDTVSSLSNNENFSATWIRSS